jgi:hypothetical protein
MNGASRAFTGLVGRVRLGQTVFAASIVAVMISFGCSSSNDPAIDNLGHDMDQMSHEVAKYGTMGISSPVLAAPNSDFAFNLTSDSDDFYNDAKTLVQGGVSQFQQSALSVGAGLSASFNPAGAAGYLAQLQQYQQAVTNNNNAQNIASLRVSLQNQAALTQYQGAVAAANQLTDPTAKANALAAAQNAYATALVAPSTQTLPGFPTATTQPTPTGNLVSQPTNLLQSFANGGNFACFSGLNPNAPSLSVNDRTAILTAAGDSATKAIFQLIGDPSLANEFKGKQIIFGVVTVSVEPGWMTRKGYAADVITNVRYKYVPARTTIVEQFVKDPAVPEPLRTYFSNIRKGIPNEKNPPPDVPPDLTCDEDDWNESGVNGPNPQGPHVAVISPLTDTQTLDLSSSSRQEQDVALSLNIAGQLAAAGASAQAQAFLNYAKSLQQDVQTRTPDVVANAFSEGSSFGFQVGPQLRAVEEVQSGKFSEAAEVMDRQSFPALVIFGFESGVYEPKVRKVGDLPNAPYKLELYEPVLKLQTANTWVKMPLPTGNQPQDVLFSAIGWLDDAALDRGPSQMVYPTENDLAELSKRVSCELEQMHRKPDPREDTGDQPLGITLASAAAKDQNCQPKSDPWGDEITASTYDMIWNRLQTLKSQLFGTESTTYLPEAYLQISGPMKVTSAQPTLIAAGSTSTIAIIGTHLDDVDTNNISVVSGNVNVGTATVQPVVDASMENHVLLLQLTPNFGLSTPASVNARAEIEVAQNNEEILAQTVTQALISQEQSLVTTIQAKIPDPSTDPFNDKKRGEVAELNKQLASLDSQTATLNKALDNRTAFQALNLDWTKWLGSSSAWTPGLEKELEYYSKRFAAPDSDTPPIGPDGKPAPTHSEKLNSAIDSLKTLRDDAGNAVNLSTAESTVTADLSDLGKDAQTDVTKASSDVQTALKGLSQYMEPLNIQPPTDKDGNALNSTLAQAIDKQAKDVDLPKVGVDLGILVANLHQAETDDSASSGASNSAKNLNGNAVTTAQNNLAAAINISNAVNSPSSSASSSSQTVSAAGQTPAQIISQAQANLNRAMVSEENLTPVEAEPIILKLPSKSDPSACAYTPSITVNDGDPCNLAVAPQSIQLQASASPGGASAGGSTPAAGSASTTPAAPSSQTTVIIAGNDLDRVDLTKITMEQASGPTLISTASMVGNAIQLTITTPATAGSVYFVLPISNTTRSVATPPISVNPAPQNSSSSAQTGAAPSVSSVQQIQLSPDLWGMGSNSNPPSTNATFLLSGNNLSQIDLTSVSLSTYPGGGTPPQVVAKSYGSNIQVTFPVTTANAGGPFVLSLKATGNSFLAINSPTFAVTLPK